MSRQQNSHRLRALGAALKARRPQPCWICHQPIDYDLPANHPDEFTVDHRRPRSKRPDLVEDPGNLVQAHRRCNSSKGDTTTGTVWVTSETF